MKKINFWTFKFQIVLLFLVMSVPAMGLALAASYTITREAQEQIIDARQNNMKILVNQYDASMESIINYVELLLFQDSSYVGLRFDESTTNYQQARIWLKDDLDKIKDYFPNISGFYVRVLKNDDCYMPKKRYKIDLETEEFLKQEIVKRKDEEKPIVVQYEDRQYLICGYKNSFLDIGFVVNLKDLEALFEESLAGGVLALEVHGDSEKVLLSSGEIENKNVLREDFATLDMSLLLYYSKADVANGIAAWKRTLLHGSILLFCLFPIFWFLIHKWFLKPMNRISWSMQEILRGNIDYRISKFSNTQEFSRIEEAFNRVLDYSRDLKIRIYEHEIAMEKEKLMNLRLQINPHLLLNSLNTISSLAVNGKTAEIQEFSLNLSKYFRYSLRNTSELVTVRSEIDFIKAYNKVQKIRYPNAFYLVYDVEEEIMEERIPPLIIQNFVENSTKYALKADTEIEILVIVRKEEEKLRISVCDNGRGMEKEMLEKIEREETIRDSRGEHVGILNCLHRLQTIYGKEAKFQITSERGTGTQVWIEIPCRQQKGAADENEAFDR